MADGTMKSARLVRSGDLVASGKMCSGGVGPGSSALRIDHVIRTQCLNNTIQLVCFPSATPDAMDGALGLRITPWHPVLVKDTPSQLSSPSYVRGTLEWMMPLSTGYPVEEHPCAHVYSFTVSECSRGSNAPVLSAEGVPMVYLGHNYGVGARPQGKAFGNDSILSHAFFGTSAVVDQLTEQYPLTKHHEFAYAPVVKSDLGNGVGPLAVGWDMSKYVGTW